MRASVGVALVFGALVLGPFPALPASAASVEPFSIKEPMAQDLLTCGYWLARPQDYPKINDDDALLIYVNDGSRGLIRVDGRFIHLNSADLDGRGTYQNADRTVFLEPHFNIGNSVGQEVWVVTGRIDLTISGKLHKVPVKGHMGC